MCCFPVVCCGKVKCERCWILLLISDCSINQSVLGVTRVKCLMVGVQESPAVTLHNKLLPDRFCVLYRNDDGGAGVLF